MQIFQLVHLFCYHAVNDIFIFSFVIPGPQTTLHWKYNSFGNHLFFTVGYHENRKPFIFLFLLLFQCLKDFLKVFDGKKETNFIFHSPLRCFHLYIT